jgi:putative oxidoreductase
MAIGMLILRMTVGLTLAAHGTQKLFGWFGGLGLQGTGQALAAFGFHPGRRHALLAGLVEVTAGILLACGLATPLAAMLAMSLMVVAAATVHWKNGFFITKNGYEFNLVLGMAAWTIAFNGPGPWSLDAGLGWSTGGDRWGLAVLIVALFGAGVQLVQRGTTTHPTTGDRT